MENNLSNGLKSNLSQNLVKIEIKERYLDKVLAYIQQLRIDEEFRKHLMIDGEEPNIDIVNSLPKLNLNTEIIEDNDVDPEEQENVEVETELEDDIDKEALELETVGSKKYYMDYSKGIIYDLQYKAIGNVDEYGDINID